MNAGTLMWVIGLTGFMVIAFQDELKSIAKSIYETIMRWKK